MAAGTVAEAYLTAVDRATVGPMRRAVPASPVLPPWLWVYVPLSAVSGVPGAAGLLVSALHRHPPGPEAVILVLVALVAGLPNVLLAAGVLIAVVRPQWYGGWAERRFRLSRDDGNPAIAEMRTFLRGKYYGFALRSSLQDGHLAQLYAVSGHESRIAVFRPLTVLWRKDQAAAEAVLLHELAHVRQGDGSVIGLVSQLIRLVSIWLLAAVLLGAALTWYWVAVGGGPASRLTGQAVLQLVQAPTAFIVPVACLWLAELGADRLTAQEAGAATVRRAQRADKGGSWDARIVDLLTHPPVRLRSRLASGGRSSTALLLIGLPAALIVQFAATLAAAVAGDWLLGEPGHTIISGLRTDIHKLLLANQWFAIAVTVLMLFWPMCAARWQSVWSPVMRASRPGPLWLYGAVAILPALFATLSVAAAGFTAPPLGVVIAMAVAASECLRWSAKHPRRGGWD
jgi:Zn-dependent protease with chaperone function